MADRGFQTSSKSASTPRATCVCTTGTARVRAMVGWWQGVGITARTMRGTQQAGQTPQQNRRLESEILENLAKVDRALGRTAEAEEAQAKAMMLWTIQ